MRCRQLAGGQSEAPSRSPRALPGGEGQGQQPTGHSSKPSPMYLPSQEGLGTHQRTAPPGLWAEGWGCTNMKSCVGSWDWAPLPRCRRSRQELLVGSGCSGVVPGLGSHQERTRCQSHGALHWVENLALVAVAPVGSWVLLGPAQLPSTSPVCLGLRPWVPAWPLAAGTCGGQLHMSPQPSCQQCGAGLDL